MYDDDDDDYWDDDDVWSMYDDHQYKYDDDDHQHDDDDDDEPTIQPSFQLSPSSSTVVSEIRGLSCTTGFPLIDI